MIDKLKIALQYVLPKHLVSRLVGKLAAAEAGFITTAFIKIFIKAFNINMAEAKHPSPSHYKTFNDFFTRELADGQRPLAEGENIVLHPVDGCVSQAGEIVDGQLIQAKGHDYSAAALLASQKDAELFMGGTFATIYLAPKDYHRIHMPLDGKLTSMTYIPGDLFSVNPLTAQNVPGLFTRNERVVAMFETDAGPMAMVLVGATIVASIETVWAGTVTPPAGKSVFHWDYGSDSSNQIELKQGDEMGRFKLGSTVILLFANNAIELADSINPGQVTRMGEQFGLTK